MKKYRDSDEKRILKVSDINGIGIYAEIDLNDINLENCEKVSKKTGMSELSISDNRYFELGTNKEYSTAFLDETEGGGYSIESREYRYFDEDKRLILVEEGELKQEWTLLPHTVEKLTEELKAQALKQHKHYVVGKKKPTGEVEYYILADV